MIKLSKKQLNEFAKVSKKIGITLDEYTEYIDKLNKVNKKNAYLRNFKQAFEAPKFSRKVTSIENYEDFKRRLSRFEYNLRGDYVTTDNNYFRERLYARLEYLIGSSPDALRAIERLRAMSTRRLIEFLRENGELEGYAYGSPEVFAILLDETAATLNNRIDLYEQR